MIARSYIGQKEIKGSKHNLNILRWWKLALTSFKDDETPWCAGYVSGVLEEATMKSARTGWARGYLDWGVPLGKGRAPVYGAIAIFERGPNAGHVGFIVGKDAKGNLMILGGNQGDAVNIKPFSPTRLLGVRWPNELPVPAAVGIATLPVLKIDGKLSTNEA